MVKRFAFVTEEEITLLVDKAVPQKTKNELHMLITFLTLSYYILKFLLHFIFSKTYLYIYILFIVFNYIRDLSSSNITFLPNRVFSHLVNLKYL